MDPITASIVTTAIGSLFGGGGGGGSSASRLDKQLLLERLADEYRWIRETYGVSSREAVAFRKAHPKLVRDYLAGKYPRISGPGPAPPGSPGTRPFVFRPGDAAFRRGVVPEVGAALRKIPVGAAARGVLRVAGRIAWPVTVGDLAARVLLPLVPDSLLVGGERVKLAPGLVQPKRAPLAPVRVTAKRIAVPNPPAAGSRPEPGPMPVGSSPSGTPARPGTTTVQTTEQRARVVGPAPAPTVARTPRPAPAPPRSSTLRVGPPDWLALALGIAGKVIGTPRSSSRTAAGPFSLSPVSEAPTPGPAPRPGDYPLTAVQTSSVGCSCEKPKRRKGERKARAVCYSGTYIERPFGLSKTKRRKIPCRQSRKKPASQRAR